MTRAVEQAPTFFQGLSDAGASVVLFPCIEFVPPVDFRQLDFALERLAEFDWLAFTSQNAVRFFRSRQRDLNSARSISAARGPKVAALGAATAEVAVREGLAPDFVAAEARSGPEFVAAFAPLARGKKVLLPQSDQAGDRIGAALAESGAQVTSVVAYRTCMPESPDGAVLSSIRRGGADMIFFGSPSAFRNFVQIVGRAAAKELAGNSAIGAIGPTTAGAIREAGFTVDFESSRPVTDEVISGMAEYFAEKGRMKAHR